MTDGQAGSEMACACGDVVSVPTLSELRRQAGREAYETNPVEAIRRLLRSDPRPLGDSCLACGMPARQDVDCELVCEQSWDAAKGRTRLETFCSVVSAILLWPTLLVRLLDKQDQEADVRGRDTVVNVSVPLCDGCQSGRPAQRFVLGLLHQSPVLQPLFEEYPDAQVTWIGKRREIANCKAQVKK